MKASVVQKVWMAGLQSGAILLCLGLIMPAVADLAPEGEPIEGGSWGQRFAENAGGYDHVQMWLVSGPAFHDGDAIAAFSSNGWSQLYNSTTRVIAEGPAATNMQFTIYFAGDRSVPFSFCWQAWNNGTLVNAAEVSWTGSAWAITNSGSTPGACDAMLSSVLVVDDDGQATATDCDDPTPCYSSIQDAINDASDGDIIKVCPGAYGGFVTINKSVTLSGANAGIHPAVGTHPTETIGLRGDESILTNNYYALHPAADDITVDGFMFTGDGGRIIDTYDDANNFHLTNCIFENDATGTTQGVIQFGGGSHTGMLLDFNLFQDQGEHTLYAGGGPFDGLTIAYNKFNVAGDSVFWTAPELVDGVIQGNEFDGTLGGTPGVGYCTLNIGLGGNIAVLDNWFHDINYTPLQIGIIGGSIVGNTFERMYPYSGYWGSAFELWGGQYGTAVSTNVSITNNTVYFNDIPGAAEPTHGLRLRGPEAPDPGIDGATIHVSNNSFIDGGARTDAHAVWHQGDATTTVDAEENYWSTLSPVVIADLMAGNVDYEPWCNSTFTYCGFTGPVTVTYVDDDYVGLAEGTEVDWPSGAGGGGHYIGYDAFATIQAGVDGVSGSTVNVAPGLYEEQVEIDSDDLELLGSGSGDDVATDTIIRSPVNLTYSYNTGSNDNYPVVAVHDATGVLVQNLRVDGYGRGNANYRFQGIGFWNAGGDVVGCDVVNVQDTPFSGAQHGVGIYATNDTGGPYTFNVSGSSVYDYQKNGMALSGEGLTANVTDCTTTGKGATDVTAQNGIQISWGASGTITDCTVSGNIYTGGNWAASGLLLYGGGTVDVSDTDVSDGAPCVYVENMGGSFVGGTMSNLDPDSTEAIYVITSGAKLRAVDAGDKHRRASPVMETAVPRQKNARAPRTFTLSDSTIVGHDEVDSVGVYYYASADTITGNMTRCVVRNWDASVYVYEAGGTIAVTANENQFYDNGAYGFVGNAPVNAEYNWWGASEGPLDSAGVTEISLLDCDTVAVADMLNAAPAGSLGDLVGDDIDYCPWLLGAGTLVLDAIDCADDTDGGEPGVQIEVELWMRDLVQNATGFQAFVAYDTGVLTFRGDLSTYSTDPFPNHFGGLISAAETGHPGELHVDGAAPLFGAGSDGTDADSLLATLVFDVDVECVSTQFAFTTYEVFVSELSYQGVPIATGLIDSASVYLDDTPPTITTCPPVTVVECDGSGNTTQLTDWLASFAATDNCGSVTLANDFVALSDECGATGASGTVTFTATDDCGNETSCVSSFTIVDTTPPAITTPAASLTVECDGLGNTVDLNAWLAGNGGAVASDVCGGVTWSNDFSNLSDDCCETGSATVTFTATDDCNLTSTTTATFTIADTIPPTIYGCPASFSVNADAGLCTAVVDWTPPTADDVCCDTDIVVNSTHNPFDTFGLGSTTVTYTFTDGCGNFETCSFVVTVEAVNDVDLEVELAGVYLPTTRCIHFVTDDCDEVADVELDFIDHDMNAGTPVRFVGTVEIPCGDWTFLCAKDEQHTLWDTTPLTVYGGDTFYTATTLLSLRGGDTDNDSDVDINDVTWLLLQYGESAEYGGCPWDGTRDADFSNDGLVGAEDHSFFVSYWLQHSECACTRAAPLLPMFATAVATADLTPAEASAADRNRDGVVDHRDVYLFEVEHDLPHTLSEAIRATAERQAEGQRSLRGMRP